MNTGISSIIAVTKTAATRAVSTVVARSEIFASAGMLRADDHGMASR